jgi:hypothetical protein
MSSGATTVPRISWDAVCARRLERHALVEPSPGATAADVVAAICGAHAQVMSAAELSIGLRLTDAARVAIQEALWWERSLIKTRGPRGTVHLLPARDLPMWTGALCALPPARSPFSPEIWLSPEQTDAVVAAIAAALAEAELTVEELTEAIVAAVGPWAGELVMPAFQGLWPRWRQIEDTAMNRGALCFGPNRGRKVTYTSPRRWLPDFRPADGATAVGELLKRYLRAYGPAMPGHFAQWLNVSRRWAADLFDAMAGELAEVEVEGNRAWVVAGDTDFPADPDQSVRLLPYFDAYAVGCHPRELVFPGRAAERALAGSQAGNFPVLLIGGVVAGVWHQRRSGKQLAFTVEPLAPLTAPQRRELEAQVGRITSFLAGTAQLTIGTVSVGPHA